MVTMNEVSIKLTAFLRALRSRVAAEQAILDGVPLYEQANTSRELIKLLNGQIDSLLPIIGEVNNLSKGLIETIDSLRDDLQNLEYEMREQGERESLYTEPDIDSGFQIGED